MAESLTNAEPAHWTVPAEMLHVIVRAEDDGSLFVRSPQIPGLAYGAASLDEVHRDLESVLAFALDRPGPFLVAEHHERRFDTAGREVVVRLAVDEHYQERREAYARLARAVGVAEQVDAVLDAPADSTGELLYLCVVPSDTVDWISTQLDAGGAATIAVAVADELLLTYRVHLDTVAKRPNPSVRHTEDQTVADMMRTSPILRPVEDSLALS